MRSHLRSPALATALAAIVLVATGCQLHLRTPTGSGTVRYRDAAFTEVTTTKDVTYGKAARLSGSMQTLKLDVYEPKGDTVAKRPAIVWVHGGGFKDGDKTSPEIVDEATHFAKLGYLNVSIDYRLSAGCSPFTDECIQGIEMAYHDAQAAVRFLRANAATYKVDVDRIAVAGTSAGAISAYNVAYGSDSPGHSGNPGYSSKVRAAVSLSGAHLTTAPAKGDPPTLDFHGKADQVVPYSWVQSTLEDAGDLGLTAEITAWEGDGHVPYAKHRTEILDQTRNFLWWTMDLAHAAS
ncbi:MAG: carboxylesterase family protein [Acidimicrobiales bacterium]